jgi:hypothetical protein
LKKFSVAPLRDGRVKNDKFSITQPFLDGSFSSSNSTEVLMKLFCAENSSSIKCNC